MQTEYGLIFLSLVRLCLARSLVKAKIDSVALNVNVMNNTGGHLLNL